MSRIGKVVLYLLYFAAVVTLSTFIAMAARAHPAATPKHAVASLQSAHTATPKQSAGAAIAKAGPRKTPAPKATSSSTTSGSLVDTGPGNVISLFVAVSLVGAISYRRRLVGRLE